jgi:hypothetical protein
LTPKRKILTLVTIICFVAPFFATGFFMIKRDFLKGNYKERFKNKAIVAIVIAASDFQWEKEGKEAIINGKLFDVQSYTVTGSNITLKGWYDEEEQKLNTIATHHQKKKKQKLLYSLIQFNYAFCNQFVNLPTYLIFNDKINHHSCYHKKVLVCFLDIANPPPQYFI